MAVTKRHHGEFETTDLPDGRTCKFSVQPFDEKYFASPFARNSFIDSSRPASIRGAYRDRHERGARDAVDAGGARTNALARGRRSRVVL